MPLPNSQASHERAERLEARISRAQKALLKRAAEIQGRTLSDFVVHAASEEATKVVQQHQVIMLTAREQAVFVQMLLKSPAPSARLRAAARHYRKVMGQ